MNYQILEDTAQIEAAIGGIYRQIFLVTDIQKLTDRLTTKSDFVVILATQSAEIVGFKLGYRYSDSTFYSWLGGVLPAYRGQGIGQKLMEIQHEFCQQKGYQYIRTKTMNRWKNMLILNLKNGFDIAETYTDAAGELKISLQKQLKN